MDLDLFWNPLELLKRCPGIGSDSFWSGLEESWGGSGYPDVLELLRVISKWFEGSHEWFRDTLQLFRGVLKWFSNILE